VLLPLVASKIALPLIAAGGICDGRSMAAAFALGVLLCAIYVFPRWADNNVNSRLDMVVALVDDGGFQIDKYVANTVDYATVNGHFYSDKAPGVALLGAPIYAVLSMLGRFECVTDPIAVRDPLS